MMVQQGMMFPLAVFAELVALSASKSLVSNIQAPMTNPKRFTYFLPFQNIFLQKIWTFLQGMTNRLKLGAACAEFATLSVKVAYVGLRSTFRLR